ncbi:hypothetical protein HCN44_007826 [Aphidius gifuensis]|uniref:Uncharacterized protein n=1 Tax=Aphidius gifuensis TaxID=684658 RepID=A0A834XPX5_APHGI|nr:hypothetical protein HCN44_007826 [Aphidius gifuensis]
MGRLFSMPPSYAHQNPVTSALGGLKVLEKNEYALSTLDDPEEKVKAVVKFYQQKHIITKRNDINNILNNSRIDLSQNEIKKKKHLQDKEESLERFVEATEKKGSDTESEKEMSDNLITDENKKNKKRKRYYDKNKIHTPSKKQKTSGDARVEKSTPDTESNYSVSSDEKENSIDPNKLSA